VGTVRRKLVEFLELCQGNSSVYEYTQEFNNLAQYVGHHVDNDSASTTNDQEGTMMACEAVEEKKRKRTMLGPIGGSSSSAPPKYRMVYMLPMGQPRRPPQFWCNHPRF
jgi:hypothetical protein